MESKEKILASLNILKRLPPTQMERNSQALASLIPDYAEELCQRVDKPLVIASDERGQYIKSEFNRDGDSFRSHLTNKFSPDFEDAIYPSEQLRKLEVKANVVFDEYRKLYYEGGVSSCYFWDKDDSGFATAWLIRKDVGQQRGVDEGSWSSINVIDVKNDKNRWTYKITSSVVLEMNIVDKVTGPFNITGSLTRQKEESHTVDNQNTDLDIFHLSKIGALVEDIESQIRSHLDDIYVSKTKDIVFATRFAPGEKANQANKQLLAGEFRQKQQQHQ